MAYIRIEKEPSGDRELYHVTDRNDKFLADVRKYDVHHSFVHGNKKWAPMSHSSLYKLDTHNFEETMDQVFLNVQIAYNKELISSWDI